jgi:hypothetical protein
VHDKEIGVDQGLVGRIVHVAIEYMTIGAPVAPKIHDHAPMLRGRFLERRGEIHLRLLRRRIDVG